MLKNSLVFKKSISSLSYIFIGAFIVASGLVVYFVRSQPAQIILETERLYFRPFVKEDLEKLYKLYSDKDVIKQMKEALEMFKGKIDKDKAKEMLNYFIEHQKENGFSYWATFEKETKDFVGRIGLRRTENPKVADAGYILHKKHWGKGYATEAMKGIIKWTFSNTNIETIVAHTVPEHHASIRVMEKSGMRFSKELELKGVRFVEYKITREK